MVLKNFAAMSALSIFRSAFQLGVNLLLAFFVTPADFGLVVYATPFILLMTMITDMGISSALVRAPALDRRMLGSAFTLLLLIGIVLAAALSALSPTIAHVARMPGLPPILSGLAVAATLGVAAIVPRAILERRLQYPLIALIDSLAVIAAAALAVALAVAGAGVLSLVVFNLALNAIRFGALYWVSRREISPQFAWGECIGLMSFGGWVLATNLLSFLARNFDNILVGTVLGAASVGLYGLAYQFMAIPLIAITWPASGVLLATLTRSDLSHEQTDRIIVATLGLTAALALPAMIGLSWLFPKVAATVLSDRWRGLGEIIAWLAPLGALQSVAAYNGALLLVAGRARAQFLFSLLNTLVTVAACVVAIRWGLMAMVKALVVVGFGLSAGFLILMVQVAKLRWQALAEVFLAPVVATLCGLLVLVVVDRLLHGAAYAVGAPAIYGLAVAGGYFAFSGTLRRWFGALRHTRQEAATL